MTNTHPLAATEWYHTDNGFARADAMDRAHAPIARLAARTLAPRGGPVLDLGCGNGALLARIAAECPGVAVEPFGLDAEPERVAHAGALQPAHRDHFAVGDLFDSMVPWRWRDEFALVLLMPGRLLEVDGERAERLRARLSAHARRLLVYAYGDWLERHGDLEGLAAAASLRIRGPVEAGSAALARID